MNEPGVPAGLINRLFAALAVTLTGDAVTLVALPLIAVLVLHASPGELALVGLAQALPILLLSIPLGAWVDRRRGRWPLLVISDVGRAGVLVSVPLAAATGVLTLPMLVGVAFTLSCLAAIFDLAFAGWVPRLLSGDALHRANARTELARSAALVVGPLLAGGIVTMFSAPIALLLDAASFVTSAVFIWSARRAEPVFDPAPTRRHIRDELIAGAQFLGQQPLVAAVAATVSINNLSRNIALGIAVLYLVDAARLGPAEIAIAFALGNAGFVVGALLARRTTARLGMGRTMQLGVALFGPSMLLFAFAPAQLAGPVFSLMLFANGFGIAIHNVNQVTVRQILTPDRLRARVASVLRLLGFGAVPVGTLIGGMLGEFIGLRGALVVSSVGLAAGSLPYVLVRIGRVRTVGDLTPADLPTEEAVKAGRRAWHAGRTP
jgi:MFS family permease